MLIDFRKMKEMIPQGGSVTFTIRANKDGKLGVLYSTKHSLAKVESTYEKSLEEDKKSISTASQQLSKVLAFTGTPEELTVTFEEKLTQSYSMEKTLADAINERTQAVNERIKELKEKKDVKKATSGKTGDTKKEEKKPEKAKETPSLGGLFGKISTGDSSSDTVEKKEADEEQGSETGEEAIETEEEGGLQEVA